MKKMFLLPIALTSIAIIPAFAQNWEDFGQNISAYDEFGLGESIPMEFLAEAPSIFDQIMDLISGFLN